MNITLFSEVKPSWEVLPFDEGKDIIPAPGRQWRENSNSPIICPMMIGNRLVFRKFEFPIGETKRQCNAKEISRYVFYGRNIIKELPGGSWNFITLDTVSSERGYYDCYQAMRCTYQEALIEEFEQKAVIRGKKYILMAMKLAKRESHFALSSFLEIYRMAGREGEELNDVPGRIVRELYGRAMASGKAVRIDRDLVVVTGERTLKFFGRTEQTRAYYDGSRAFFFSKSPLTGAWIPEKDIEIFKSDSDLRDRYIDRDLFENTCMERFINSSIEHKFRGDNKINYGQMLAQAAFLSAEQASKVNADLYERVLENIYDGKIKDGKLTLPELLGITGGQVKFMDNIIIPFDLNEFAICMKDPEFKKYFPDVKKRMFAASVFLSGSASWFMSWNISRSELFEAASTICSLERLDKEKRNKLLGEYLDYVKMRRKYVAYISNMQEDDPLFEEIRCYGDAPINLKPSIIKDRHDKLGKIVEVIQCAGKINKYTDAICKRKRNEAKTREYKAEKYSVIMPKDALDIVREGRELQHCVGRAGYIESMAAGDCTILFVRDNNCLDKPLITMEERGGVIRQCYGFRDSFNHDPEVGRFISDYAEKKKLKIQTTIYAPIKQVG